MAKKTIGILLGLFFGLLGLLGLLMCNEQEEKSEFISGWFIGLIISAVFWIIFNIILYSVSLSMI